ncbi:hypothetical protein HMPREF2753_01010 [Neisseria sp. HMSC071C03]|nr:hypothetical protein HMPREF2844_08460 [Neisseria sp. HMSC072F04]OHR41828.1 hypothetical protein HMPREF3054_06295 [Neisseria sp. HMSC071B12]OHR47726.1 hypothetical protein HMPREF2753_01010 [Neisseria sp. HMSC071C03]
MIWRVPLSFLPAWKQRRSCRVVQARPALFLCCETVFVGKAHATKMGLSISVGIHARQAIWPIHLIFDAAPIAPAVIPTQAGIQSSTIQNYLKIVIISNF